MRARGRDYYQILHVDPTADLETIRVAYRGLAKRYHPDVNTSPDAKARMQEVNDAYRTLGDPSKRLWYDISIEREKIRRQTGRRPYPPGRSHRPSRPRSASTIPRPRIPAWWLWLLAPIMASVLNFDFNSSTKYRSYYRIPTSTAMFIPSDQVLKAESLLEVGDWPVVLNERFETSVVPFLKGPFKDQSTSGSRFVLDGKYHWDITVNNQPYFDVMYYNESISDFYLAVEIQKLRGHKESGYGVMFRCPNSNEGYAFYLTNKGLFSVLVRDYNGWAPLLDWTYSSAIKPIDANRLVVIARGPHYDFYINGEPVGDLTDSRFGTGKVGLSVGFEKEATGEYTFDNFELRQPQDTIGERTPYPTWSPNSDSIAASIRRMNWEILNLMIDEL